MSQISQLSTKLVSTMKNSKVTRYLDVPLSPEDSGEEEHFLAEKKSSSPASPIGEGRSDHPQQRWSKRCSGWLALSILISSAIVLGLLTMLLSLTQHCLPTGLVPIPEMNELAEAPYHCGHSPEEAIKRGCIFDIMSYGYIPPSCYNDTESKYWTETYGPWEWFYDKNRHQPIPMEELRLQPYAHTTQDYHVAHCLYLLQSIHLASMSGGMVTHIARRIGHTAHCTNIILSNNFTSSFLARSKAPLIYAQCVTLA